MRHRVVSTAGHVDHGKSTLVRALTGMEPDRLAEERRRGLTIELGYAWTELPGTASAPDPVTVAFVDVPGHERFIGTMLAGTGAAPAALLVVAADDGWSAQSSEHRDVLDLLEVPGVARVVTKADSVDADRVGAVVAELEGRTAGTSLAGAPVVVTDAVSGRGLDGLRRVLRDRLAALPEPVDADRPRAWLDRAFALGGVGTVVTGTLTEGRLTVGAQAVLLPGGHEVRIRRLQALGSDVEVAHAGTRVAANLAGVGHAEVERGDVLAAGGPWRATSTVDLWVRVLPGQRLDRPGAWHLFVGTASSPCLVRPITGPIDGGGTGPVRVELAHPLPLVAADRVVLREAGRRATVAGGVVADPQPLPMPRGVAARAAHGAGLARVAAVRGASVEDRGSRLVALVELAGGARDAEAVAAAAGWPPGAPQPGGLAPIGAAVVRTEPELARWTAAVRTLGPGTHDRAAVAEAAGRAGAPPEVAGALADHLVTRGVLTRTTGGVALAEHADDAAAARLRRAAALLRALDAEPFSPPDLEEAARAAGCDHREVAALVQAGAVVRCGRVAFSRRAVELGVERLHALYAAVGPFTAAQARQAWGTTRRYAIPLLEHLDRTGVTAFDGQLRRLRR